MAVRMVSIRRTLRRRDADERDDVGCGVGERVKAVGEDRDRARRVAKRDLGDRDGQIEEENAPEDARDLRVAIRLRQKTLACGIGHHRSWTLPMMYSFGTIPQWRLSELLFRWSPITK